MFAISGSRGSAGIRAGTDVVVRWLAETVPAMTPDTVATSSKAERRRRIQGRGSYRAGAPTPTSARRTRARAISTL